jgi:FkbM family methyltransferase
MLFRRCRTQMKFVSPEFVQRLFGMLGLQVRRLNAGVSLHQPTVEMLRLAGDTRLIVEVGAADGRDAAQLARDHPAIQVIAFEPEPGNYIKLKATADGLQNLKTVEKAVSDKPGRMTFFQTHWADASSLLKPKKTNSAFDKYLIVESQVEVDVTSLDAEFLQNNSSEIGILKIDAQGAENRILRGAEGLLSQKRIKVIYCEVSFLQLYHGSELYHSIASYLASQGYRLHSLYNLVHNQEGRLAWGDALFVIDEQDPSRAAP